MNCLTLLPAESRWLRSPCARNPRQKLRGIETPNLPACDEKQRLRDRCSEATVQYASAVNAVMRSRGKVAEEEYGRIRDLVDEARNAARSARTALQQHKHEHGC